MQDYNIVDTFTLPSLAKIYKDTFDPDIRLRSMTTNEEMRRMNQTDRPLKILASIIDDCILDKIPISSYDMCFADFQFLLHKLRITTYGDEYKMQSTCPYCLSVNQGEIHLSDMQVKEYSDKILKYLDFTLPKSGDKIELNFQTARIIDLISYQSKEHNKKNKQENSTVLQNILYTLKAVNGRELDEIQKENYIRNLPMKDTNYITACINKFNEGMGINTSIEIECDSCGLAYTSSFRETGEFFRPSIDI